MKPLLTIIGFLIGIFSFAQNLDGFKYFNIQPSLYTTESGDKYGIGAEVKAALINMGLTYVENDSTIANKCLIITCNISNSDAESSSNFVKISFFDCNDQEVYSHTGTGSTFTVKSDLKKATEQVLIPIKTQIYEYDSTLTPIYVPRQKKDDKGTQPKVYTDRAILHFINVDKIWGTVNESLYPSIQLNSLFIGISDPKSHLKYTIYSEGLLSIISRSDLCTTIQLQIDISHGNEYYFQMRYRTSGYDGQKQCITQITKEQATQLLSNTNIKTTIELSENPDKPIGNVKPKVKDKKGTGFLLNNKGYVITNYHVIEDAKSIKVKGIKGDMTTSFEAKLIASDISNDLAIIQISSNLIQFDSTIYYKGDIPLLKAEDIYVLGYPLTESMGEEVKITKGVINSLSGYKGDLSCFQVSAQVQPGNSGGPVFNTSGQLIGIISSKLNQADDVGYAIKISYIQNFLKQAGIYFDEPKVITETNILKLIDLYSKCTYIIETDVD